MLGPQSWKVRGKVRRTIIDVRFVLSICISVKQPQLAASRLIIDPMRSYMLYYEEVKS